MAVPNSESDIAPSSAYSAPAVQIARMSQKLLSSPAIVPGRRRIPTPTVPPKITATPKPRPRMRTNGEPGWARLLSAGVWAGIQATPRVYCSTSPGRETRSPRLRDLVPTGFVDLRANLPEIDELRDGEWGDE